MAGIVVGCAWCLCVGVLRSITPPPSTRLCKGCPWSGANRYDSHYQRKA
jgi:hypothetical protein